MVRFKMEKKLLIHVSSSVYLQQISRDGLRAMSYTKDDLRDCIARLLPHGNHDLLTEKVLSSKCPAASLVKSRVIDKKKGLAFMPEGFTEYYKNIVNCVKDGGEFFSAIRHALEFVTKSKIEKPYQNAYPIVCKVFFDVINKADGCQYLIHPVSRSQIHVPDSNRFEISLDQPLPSNCFVIDYEPTLT